MRASNMLAVSLAGLLTLTVAQTTDTPVTGTQGNATIVENNPPGIVYTATLPTTEFFNPKDPRGNVVGSVAATANPNGIGVNFKVSFSNLPTSGGPFLYHIHAYPVPADGNCTGTKGHLDPFIRGETPACDSKLPQTCQVGDLSGKHGKITLDPFTVNYKDDFATTVEGLGAFFGNRSITLHFANTTRLTCANFTMTGTTGFNGTGGGNSSTTYSASASASASATATGTATATTSSPVTQTSSSPPLQFSGLAVAGSAPVSFAALMGAMGIAFLL